MSRAVREALDQELERAYKASPVAKLAGGTWSLSNVSVIIARHFTNLVTAAKAEADEEHHRWLLWEICPHDGKYGDDGEMQCGLTDFLRHPLWECQRHVNEAWDERKKAEMPNYYALIEARARLQYTIKWMDRFRSLLEEIDRGDYGDPGRHNSALIENMLDQFAKEPTP